MKKYPTIVLIALLTSIPLLRSYAQKEANNWFFGDGQWLSFYGDTLAMIPNKLSLVADEAVVSMSNPITGEFQFYFDGTTVWSAKSEALMKNGSGLKSGKSSSMGGLSFPFMSNPRKFFLFTAPCLTGEQQLFTNGMYVNEIDMSKDAGKGEVILKNQILNAYVLEKITGTLTCDGKGYWVVVHDKEDAVFYSYKIINDVLEPIPVISRVGQIPIGHQKTTYILGQMKMSPDGSKLAMSDGDRGVELFRFNRKTGQLSDPILIPAPNSPYNPTNFPVMYSVSFSPDSKLLYIFGESTRSRVYRIYQYDVSKYDRGRILSSQFVTQEISKGDLLISALSLAPDGKLYFHTTTDSVDSVTKDPLRFIHCINKPNVKGAGCQLALRVLRISPYNCRGLPNYGDYLFSSKTLSSGCEKPKPKFVFSPDTICKGGVVRVFNMSIGAQECVWHFQRGKPENWYDSIPPLIRYDTVGNYEIKLTVHNSNGDSTISRIVHVLESPYADAGKDKYVCEPKVQIGTPPQFQYTYSWSPKQGLNDSTLAQPTADVGTKPTKYVVTVTDKRGCRNTDTVEIGPFKSVLKDEEVHICKGLSKIVKISGEGTIEWKPTLGVSDPTSFHPILSPVKSEVFRVIVRNGKCSDTALISVYVHELPIADAGPDHSVCGNSISIGTTGRAEHKYEWSPSVGLNDSTLARPIATVTKETRYILKVTNAAGCIDYDTVFVRVSSLEITVSKDTSICLGGEVKLLAEGASDYAWSPSEGLSATNSATPIAKPIITTRYRVIGTSGSCIDTAFVTVNVVPPPKANAGNDISLCGNSGQIGGDAETGLEYVWAPTTGLSDPTSSKTSVTPTGNTRYILKVSNALGCYSYDTVLVSVGNLKAFISNDTSICAGNWAQLKASGGTEYEWSPVVGLDNPKTATPKVTPTTTTTYTVKVKSGICVDSAKVTVTVVPLPTANAGSDYKICSGGSVVLDGNASQGTSVEWSNEKGTIIGTMPNLSVKPNNTTYYVLKTTNSLGCSDFDTTRVIVIPYPTLTVSPDQTLCKGDTVTLTANGADRYEWHWENKVLSTKEISFVPQTTTKCIVYGFNELNCSDTAEVNITVNQPTLRKFVLSNLSPEDKKFVVGEKVPMQIVIPQGVTEFSVVVKHETGTFTPFTALQHTLGSTWSLDKVITDNTLTIMGNGADTTGGSIELYYEMYLPAKWTDKKYFGITAENVKPEICSEYTFEGTKILVDKYCASGIRGVSGSGVPFSLQQIYPNPTYTDQVTIHYSVGIDIPVNISVVNSLGEEVFKSVKTSHKPDYYELTIDTKDFMSGMYFVRVQSSLYNHTVQFVKD